MSDGPPPVPGGRSPEEREAARREREARRAGRQSKSAGSPRRQNGPRAADSDRDGGWLARARGLVSGGNGEAPRAASEQPRPAPSRPVPSRPAPSRPSPATQARRPGLREAPQGDRRRTALGLALGAGVLALLAAWLLISLFQPFKGDGQGQVRVVVPRGAGVGQIGDLLENRGVVSSSFFFSARARLGGRGGDLKPGSYRLRRDMSYAAALDVLAKGPPPDVLTLTIPEGRSRREVARVVGDSLDGSYLEATRRSRSLDPREYGARNARDLEGFLFPATYELKRGRPVGVLVDQQLAAFRRNFQGVDLSAARRKNLTPYDVLIIASLVEREASVPRERPIVASVIYNRLRRDMRLDIDATVRYATGNWTRPLRESELDSPSPYNTRRRSGLPPGPIGSPGLASIKAAARPARTNYLFYVVKPCGRGEHAFSATDAEFQRDVRRYNSERARRGGRSPTDC